MEQPERLSLIVRLEGLDRRHYRATDRYARDVQHLYDTAARELSGVADGIGDRNPDKPFTFADYPRAGREASRIANDLTRNVLHVIEAGQRSQWLAATYRADEYLGTILDTSRLTRAELEQYGDRNLDGLAAFQARKVQGMGLSDRVWQCTEQFRQHIELAVDVAIAEGKSAAELAREIQQYLVEPNRLFRRVRDKYGNLRLSKAAAAYHPGRGVYRSSYQNALRLARTEINMAYRLADWQRWQRLDFVVGIRIMLSNNHTIVDRKGKRVPLIDICDELAGDYPKTFRFVGWHPNCRCWTIPILQSTQEMHKERRERLRALMNDEEYRAQPSANTITDVPEGFKAHIAAIAERSQRWKSQPYYIRDNFQGGTIAGGLSAAIPHRTPVGGTPAKLDTPPQPCTAYDADIDLLKTEAYSLGLDVSYLDALRAAGLAGQLKTEVQRLLTMAKERRDAWTTAEAELSQFVSSCPDAPADFMDRYSSIANTNSHSIKRYYETCIQTLKNALLEARAIISKRTSSSDIKPHPALLKKYTSEAEIDATFASINHSIKDDKWFANGDLKLVVETKKGRNGSTDKRGRISLTAARIKRIKSALSKIAKGKSAKINKKEAEAMAVLWHEITHNRNVKVLGTLTDIQRSHMELANEFVARKTLTDFYRELGCTQTPHPEFAENRSTTAYNRMVKAYDYVISACGLNAEKVLTTVREYLFNESYDSQVIGLQNGLIVGGLAHLDGTPANQAELNKIIRLCRMKRSVKTIDAYLRLRGFIK